MSLLYRVVIPIGDVVLQCPKCKNTDFTKLIDYGPSIITYKFKCQKYGPKWRGL